MSTCEGDSSTTKRDREAGMVVCQNKRQRPEEVLTARMMSEIIQFASQTLQAISELFIDLPNDSSTTVFGERRDRHLIQSMHPIV